MRSPYLCTLTGADDTIDPGDLFRLSDEFPFVEWGILYHASKQGQGRYPSFSWIETLCSQMPPRPHARFAFHVCGEEAIKDFPTGNGDTFRKSLPFGRVQINFVATRYDPELVIGAVRRNRGKKTITQHNATNAGLWPILAGYSNHAVLFDTSGGRGISPEVWPSRLSTKDCGYAGGLGPDNLARELPRIQQAAGQNPYWIDMEGKLRNEADRFDLARARLCLEIFHQFIHS